MERFGQMHFEFKEWKDAFRFWDENKDLYDGKIRFIVSTHPYSSGYWIEDLQYELQGDCVVYATDSEVQDLRKRVREMASSHQTHLVI